MVTKLQRWFLIVAMWAVILFSIFVFYWMMVRPSKIRQMCVQKAKQVSAKVTSDLSDTLEINRAVYLDCLRSNGLDK
ncbi:MAG: hypothetical protein NTW64_06480 [Candidatus Omnitrophica bacterium]|nr:hypothetical protein [Candidatus Omnitrophota bacterium]